MRNRLSYCAVLAVATVAVCACSPPGRDELMADAKAAIAAQEMRTAEIHLKNVLQANASDREARQLLGQVLLERGDPVGAEESLRRALTLGSERASSLLPLVRALVAQRQYQKALDEIEQGPELDAGDQPMLLGLKGDALRALGDPEGAEAAYRAALDIDPSSAELRTALGALLLGSGRADEGRALIAAVLADNPTFLQALLLRGAVEQADRAFPTAEATFQQVVDAAPGNAAQNQTYLLGLAQLVEVQLAQGKLDAAAVNADALLSAQPDSPVAAFFKSAVDAEQGDLDAAERRLEGLVARVPNYWQAYRVLGTINVRQNQLEQALSYLRTAVANNPADDSARLQLVELYIRQNDVEAARALVETWQANGADPGLLLAFAGRANQQAGQQEQAERLFNESERLASADPERLSRLSAMYVAAGEFQRAVRVLEQARAGGTEDEGLTDYLLGLVQLRAGNVDEAAASARRLAERYPTAAGPKNLQGTIALYAGQREEAKTLFGEALKAEPENAPALRNLARLAALDNDAAQAAGFLERLVAVEPTDVQALFGLTELAARSRDFPAAREWLSKAPESPQRERMAAELLAFEGKLPEAAAAFSRAYAAEPSAQLAVRAHAIAKQAGIARSDVELLDWVASHPEDQAVNFLLGSLAIERGDEASAIRRFETVLATSPDHAVTLNNLAWLYSKRGDERALGLAERAYNQEPENPAVADTFGWLLVQRGRAAEGLPLLETAIGGLADLPEVRYHWGAALAATGNRTKGLEELQLALAAASFEGRDDAVALVAELQGR